MTILNQEECLVIIIDIQEKLLNAVFNKDIVDKNSVIMAKTATELNIPVIVTEQYPKGLGSTIPAIKDSLLFNTPYIEKTSFSAPDEPEFLNILKQYAQKQIILFGIETHICVSQTANSLTQAGYYVNVLSDASGSRYEYSHKAGLERIRDNGGHIITTEIALFELLKSSKHSNFKNIQSLIK